MHKLGIAVLILLVVVLLCNDWDGMDRSGWDPTPTCEVPDFGIMPTYEPGGKSEDRRN